MPVQDIPEQAAGVPVDGARKDKVAYLHGGTTGGAYEVTTASQLVEAIDPSLACSIELAADGAPGEGAMESCDVQVRYAELGAERILDAFDPAQLLWTVKDARAATHDALLGGRVLLANSIRRAAAQRIYDLTSGSQLGATRAALLAPAERAALTAELEKRIEMLTRLRAEHTGPRLNSVR